VNDPHKYLCIRGRRSGCLYFEGMPLGTSVAVALFQGQIESVIGEDLIALAVTIYIDDMLVFLKTKEDHLRQLEKIF